MTSSLGSHPSLTEGTQEAFSLQRKRRLPVPLRLLVALAALIGIGTGLLLLPWMTTERISLRDALFTSTSASAVTGLSILTTSIACTRPGQASSNVNPVKFVSTSMRTGGRPIWNTTPGRPKSAAVTWSNGAPNSASARMTRFAFSGVGSTQTSRSPVARGRPWTPRA